MKSLSHISIVLVNPEFPENIGSVARCMKNMGLSELILVNPVHYQRIETYALAHRSQDIVDRAVVYSSLQEALSNFSFVVGTTKRIRGRHYPLYTPQEAVREIKKVGSSHGKVALVFGRESRGLTNEELRNCNIVSTIPTARSQPAINVAQAVMIYCYELYKNVFDGKGLKVFEWDLAENRDLSYMYEHLKECLLLINFHPRSDIKDFIDRFRRVLGRVMLEKRDVKLFHKLFAEVEWAIKNARKVNGK